MTLLTLFRTFLLLWVALPAWAGGSASPLPPAPPAVDFTELPASASMRKTGADGKPHPVLAHLLLDHQAVAAGSSVKIGLYLEQDEGWHTYWKSPGDIGQPTEIEWDLPEGLHASEHVYPVPQRFEDSGLVSFGYSNQVLLISELTVDANVKPGTYTVNASIDSGLKASARWLVCQTSCIPGDAQMSLPIQVVAKGTETPLSPYAPLFEHFSAQHPTDALATDSFGWDFALDRSAVKPNEPFKAAFLLTPTEGHSFGKVEHAWPTFTPIATSFDWMLADEHGLEVKNLADGRILVVLKADAFEPEKLPTNDKIGGLVQLKVDGKWVRTEITANLPWAAADATVEPSNSPLWKLEGASTPPPPSEPGEGPQTQEATTAPAASPPSVSLFFTIGVAFIGGLILNVMPCVLPVLMLKLYGLIEQADITTTDRQKAGVAYTVGILSSFWALAAVIALSRSVLGMEVSWGFQFQYPPYVAALTTIVFAFGLSLFGVFEIPAMGVGAASEASSKEGAVGYLFTGMFATLLATPCSAPFLGTAIAYAFGAGTLELVAIFTSIGLGLAAPFLFIAFVPAAFRFLPSPGEWMDAFKQLLGFTLIATTIWLVGVLMAQIGPDRTTNFLAFLMFVALGTWIMGRWGGVATSRRHQLIALGAALLITGGAGAGLLDFEIDETDTCDDGSLEADLDYDAEIPWQPFSEDRVKALAGKVVFVDFTADWCLTCKVNERTILETASVRTTMKEQGVVPLKADWTRRDPVITEWLKRHGRAGVPMYLILPADPAAAPIVLPEVITQGMVLEAFQKAT